MKFSGEQIENLAKVLIKKHKSFEFKDVGKGLYDMIVPNVYPHTTITKQLKEEIERQLNIKK